MCRCSFRHWNQPDQILVFVYRRAKEPCVNVFDHALSTNMYKMQGIKPFAYIPLQFRDYMLYAYYKKLSQQAFLHG